MNIDRAANELYNQITKNGHPEWLAAIGAGDNIIIVYIIKDAKRAEIPEVFNGFRTKIEKSGKIKAFGNAR